MTDTVYIVTSGSYSDYKIRAVFLTREEAEAFLEPRQGTFGSYGADEGIIEEWPIGDKNNTPVGMKAYLVMLAQDGSSPYVDDMVDHEAEAAATVTRITDRQELETYLFARDEAHAIKIANERRSILLGLERWIPGDHSGLFHGQKA